MEGKVEKTLMIQKGKSYSLECTDANLKHDDEVKEVIFSL